MRRGTKGNPFKVGDKVRLKDVSLESLRSRVGVVVEVTAFEKNSPEIGERSYAPIRYKVRWTNETTDSAWMPARYLEEVK